MGRIYLACLGKELKEQRSQWIMIITMIPAVFLAFGLFFDTMFVGEFGFIEMTAGACLIAAVWAFGIDLLAGESRRRKAHFLNRMPAGLNPAFAAKITTFFLLVTLCFSSGILVSSALYAVHHLVTGESHEETYGYAWNLILEWREMLPWVLSFIVSSSMMLLAMSCWVKRIGSALALWIAYLSSCYILVALLPGSLASPALLLWIHPVLGFIIAYITFVQGYRLSDGPSKAMLFGMAPLLALFTGAFALTLKELADFCLRLLHL